MALLTGSWLLDLSLLLLFVLFLIYRHFSNTFSYFRWRGVPYIPPRDMNVLNNSQSDVSRLLYNSFPGERFFGYFLVVNPIFLIKDSDLIQRILVKDFNHFEDRGFDSIESDFLNTKALFNLKGQTWRAIRNKLSHTFTSGKLKQMFEQFLKSGDHLLDSIEHKLEKTFDTKQLSDEYAVEVIGSTAFGLDFSKENPERSEFIRRVTTVFLTDLRQIVTFYTFLFFPKLANILRLSFLSPGSEEYFLNLTKATKTFRLKNNYKRNDFFDLLLELQHSDDNSKHTISSSKIEREEDAHQKDDSPENNLKSKFKTIQLTDQELAAQSFGFLLGGSDTVAGTLALALFHIAKEPAVQRRMTIEVDENLAKHGGYTYQAIKNMVYLDQVLQETLRLYPVISLLSRECVIPYRIPDSDIILEKGARLSIPVTGLHMDPNYYPDPERFDPDRFLDNNHKPSSTYLPFGDGPRMCIAQRFAIIEMKVFLAKLLSQYSFSVSSKTAAAERLTMDKKSFSPKPLEKLWVDLKRRNPISS